MIRLNPCIIHIVAHADISFCPSSSTHGLWLSGALAGVGGSTIKQPLLIQFGYIPLYDTSLCKHFTSSYVLHYQLDYIVLIHEYITGIVRSLEPKIAQASAQLMLLSTVSSVMIQYAYLNMLPLSYAAVFLLLGFSSGYTGKSLLDHYVRKYNRTAIIIYALAVYTFVAAFSMYDLFLLIFALSSNVDPHACECTLTFRSAC
jgi:hypothetical protein